MTSVLLAQLSATMEEAEVETWLVADGDQVVEGQPIVEVTTDKVTVRLEATAAGTLRIRASAGQAVPVGAVLAEID